MVLVHVHRPRREHLSVLVTGYFDRGNLGDDLFQTIWTYIFNKEAFRERYNVVFQTVDDLQEIGTEVGGRFDVIVIAGGDVLNYYFLTPIQVFIRRVAFKGRVCAFSVGIPYTIAIANGLIDFVDHTTCRAKIDFDTLTRRYGREKCSYFPDISCYLRDPDFLSFCASSVKAPFPYADDGDGGKRSRPLRVGVFLARTIFKGNPVYKTVIQGIAQGLNALHDRHGCEIILVPFNTFASALEDDRIINQDVNEHLTFSATVCTSTLDVYSMFQLFRTLDLAVAMRYHAHMYAIASATPVVSLMFTPKVTNLVSDCKLGDFAYRLPLDSSGSMPIMFDGDAFVKVTTTALEHADTIVDLQHEYLSQATLPSFEDEVETVLLQGQTDGGIIDKEVVTLARPKFPAKFQSILHVIKHLVCYIFETLDEEVSDADLTLVADEIFQGNVTFLELLQRRTSKELKQSQDKTDWTRREWLRLGDFLAALACFALVQIPYPKYHFGMSKKILDATFNARADFTWVWTDNHALQACNHKETQLLRVDNGERLFDATFVGIEDFKGCHRSGWQYVVDHLMPFHSKNCPLILDNYLDRTFHWAHDVYEYTGIIPFPRAWCGFIHHTVDEQFSPFNVVSLFAKPTFQQSLSTCKGLFTLSKDLGEKVRQLLLEGGWDSIPVATFVHPTEFSKVEFSVDKFLTNADRKVIMVGAWLRDNFAIYRMMPHEDVKDQDRIKLRKAILRGRNMSNYFKPTELALTVTGADQEDDHMPYKYAFKPDGVGPFTNNKFALGLMRAIDEAWHSVEEISTLDNDSYDTLLSENVIFLRLVDASAVNTIIECIVRKTPVLVNRLPAVIEMLGEDYPFYYEGLTEAGAKVNHLPTIRATVAYLTQLDTSQFKMDRFITDLQCWLKSATLA